MSGFEAAHNIIDFAYFAGFFQYFMLELDRPGGDVEDGRRSGKRSRSAEDRLIDSNG